MTKQCKTPFTQHWFFARNWTFPDYNDQLEGCHVTTCWVCVTSTLTLGLHKHVWNTCANSYWNPSKIVEVMVEAKIWPSNMSLTLGLPERMFQMAHLHAIKNSCTKSFWKSSTTVEVMVQTNSDGCTHTYTPNCHCDNEVLFNASRRYKNKYSGEETTSNNYHWSLNGN